MKAKWYVVALWALLAAFAMGGVVWAQSGDDLLDMEFEGARLADVVRVLGELGGYNVIVDANVQGNVTFRLREMTVDDAIDIVVRTSGYSYRKLGNTLVIGTEASLRDRFDTVVAKVLRVEYADPAQLLPVLRLLLPGLQAQVDAAERALVVRGLPDEVTQAEEFVRQRDVPPLVNQEFIEARIIDILRDLARQGGYNLLIDGEISGTMTVSLRRLSVNAAIDLVARRADLEYAIDGPNLIISGKVTAVEEQGAAPAAQTAAQALEQRFIQLVHITPSKILEAVRVIAVGGEVWADEGSGTMIVSATPAALDRVNQLVALLDVPELAVRGILQQGDDRLAIVQIDQDTHIVRGGDVVGAVKVLAVDSDGVMIETVHGQRVLARAGGR